MSAASIITSIVTGGTNSHATVSEEVNAYATDFITPGVVGSFTNTAGVSPSTGSFAVNQDSSADMGVTITGSGNTTNSQALAYITGQATSQNTQVFRARMSTNYTSYTINANSSGVTKYDWIYLSFSPTYGANPDSAADDVITLYTSRSTSSSADNGSPPTYGLLLAVVTVANGASSIVNANISDRRVGCIFNISGGGVVNTDVLYNPVKFSYSLTNSFNTGTASNVKVTYDTKIYDTGSNYDSVTNHRFTAPMAGFYHFTATAQSAVVGASRRQVINFFKNGTYIPGSNGTDQTLTSNYFGLVGVLDIQLAQTDYIEVDIYADNGQSFITGIFSGFLISKT